MVGGTRIIAIGTGSQEAARDEILLTQVAPDFEESADMADDTVAWEEEPAPRVARYWLLPAVGLAAVAIWTGLFAWALRAEIFSAADPREWISLVRDWAVPVLLIAVLSLIILRTSRREALRFGDASRLLRDEAAQLELRLVTVNRELSLAREFIASQSRDLESLGRLATERLSKEADRLHSLIGDNHDRIEAIGTVSTAALDNMERLRGQLPVIASSAKDVTNNIGNAGRTAHAQLQDMITGFQRLNEFGAASERQVQLLRGMVEHTLAEFGRQAEQLDDIATQRFTALAERGTEFRTQLETHEVEALAAIRTRAHAMAEELEEARRMLDSHEAESLTSLRARTTALRDEGGAIARALRDAETRATDAWAAALTRLSDQTKGALAEVEAVDAQAKQAARARLDEISAEVARFEAELAQRQATAADETAERRAAAERADADAIAQLRANMASIDDEIAARRAAHEQQSARIAANGDLLAKRLEDMGERLAEIAAHGGEAEAQIAASVQTLADKLAASRTALAGTDQDVAAITDNAVRLLELIRASAQHSREDLPEALAAGQARLSEIEARVAALRDTVSEAGQQGEGLLAHVGAAERQLAHALSDIERFGAALAEKSEAHHATLLELRATLDGVAATSSDLSERAQGELSQALDTLRASVDAAIAAMGQNGAQAVTALARQLGEESSAAIERSMRNSAAESAGQLEQAAAHAAGVSREAAIQLRDQLAKVNELAANLERRVAHARERAEEQVDNDFTRRVALITDSLNSHSIDIARALSTDISDTAWSSYLRGDRGIFTRRAVALLESGEAKAITQIYERDREFHDHVSRYIHDFEAMLRQVLSARDGHALGVTLLSSDMGKLYVALAQAIERLRS